MVFICSYFDIEVCINLVVYLIYFEILCIDVVGGSVDDIFWLFNVYFVVYVDSGWLMKI